MVAERDDVEAVVAVQAIQRQAHRRARLLERIALHRAGAVDDQDQFAPERHRPEFARRHQHQQGMRPVQHRFDEQRALQPVFIARGPDQFEIPAGGAGGIGQLDRSIAAAAANAYRVVQALDRAQGEAGVKFDAEVQAGRRGAVVMRRRNRWNRGVAGVAIRIVCVTRKRGGWKAQPEPAVFVGYRMAEPDPDFHVLAGRDVGQRGRKQVGAMLLDQPGASPLFAGVRIPAWRRVFRALRPR